MPARPRHSQRALAARLAALVACLALLAGCGTAGGRGGATPSASPAAVLRPPAVALTPQGATPTATASAPSVANPALLAMLREAQTLTITDNLVAFREVRTVERHFVLRRTADGFVGDATYHAGSLSGGHKVDVTRQVVIPQWAFDTFIELLADAPAQTTPPTPQPSHSDYSPKLYLELSTPKGDVSFFSDSQAQSRLPWRVRVGTQSYYVVTGEPLAALDGLEPYLRREETVRAMAVALEATQAAHPTPTRLPPPICRPPATAIPTPIPPSFPTPAPGATHVTPGAQPQIGMTINLAEYFELGNATFTTVSDNFAPFNLSGQGQVAPLVAALDTEGVVTAPLSPGPPRDAVSLTFAVYVKPVYITYHATLGALAFSVNGQSYSTPAPPALIALLPQLICARQR